MKMNFKITSKFFSITYARRERERKGGEGGERESLEKQECKKEKKKTKTKVSKLSSRHLKSYSLQAIIDREFTEKVTRHETKAQLKER